MKSVILRHCRTHSESLCRCDHLHPKDAPEVEKALYCVRTSYALLNEKKKRPAFTWFIPIQPNKLHYLGHHNLTRLILVEAAAAFLWRRLQGRLLSGVLAVRDKISHCPNEPGEKWEQQVGKVVQIRTKYADDKKKTQLYSVRLNHTPRLDVAC